MKHCLVGNEVQGSSISEPFAFSHMTAPFNCLPNSEQLIREWGGLALAIVRQGYLRTDGWPCPRVGGPGRSRELMSHACFVGLLSDRLEKSLRTEVDRV